MQCSYVWRVDHLYQIKCYCSFHTRKTLEKKNRGCYARSHLGLDGTSVKLGTAALGLIKSRCEALARQ